LDILLSGKSALQYHHGKHNHKTWELIVNLEGEGYMEIEGQKIPFSPYTIVCIPPHVEHSKDADTGFCDTWVWCSDFPMLDTEHATALQDDSDHNITSLINVLYSVQYRKEPNKKAVAESLMESIQQLILSRLEKKPLDARVDAILNDKTPPMDVYRAVESAAPAILAAKSAEMGGVRLDVPDFRA
jgi:gentisate 1,2-dioxygenase